MDMTEKENRDDLVAMGGDPEDFRHRLIFEIIQDLTPDEVMDLVLGLIAKRAEKEKGNERAVAAVQEQPAQAVPGNQERPARRRQGCPGRARRA